MAESLKVRDVVRLPSDDLKMTIAEILGLKARCVWHDGKKNMGGWYPIAALVKVEDDHTRVV